MPVEIKTVWRTEYILNGRREGYEFDTKREAAEYISELPKKVGLVQFYPATIEIITERKKVDRS